MFEKIRLIMRNRLKIIFKLFVCLLILCSFIFLFYCNRLNMYAVNMQQILSKNGEIYADNIVVEKKQRKMYLMKKGAVLKEYKISLGSNPVGAKQQENDGKTPEGLYYIESHNHKSKFHLSLKISYPNEDDKKWAKKHNVSAGGDIMIHGFPNWVPDFLFNHFHKSDWTRGCIAVTNEQIEEIWKLVKDGTPIKIMP